MVTAYNKMSESGYFLLWLTKCNDKWLADIVWLVLVLAETTEEEDVWVLGRRRAGCRWSPEMQMNHSDSMQDDGSITQRLHANNRLQTACRGDEKDTAVNNNIKGTNILQHYVDRKPLIPRGSVINNDTHLQRVMNISISPQPTESPSWETRDHAWWEQTAQVQKKNNLSPVTSIHLHSKRQYSVLERGEEWRKLFLWIDRRQWWTNMP